jgi:hypothetical protein
MKREDDDDDDVEWEEEEERGTKEERKETCFVEKPSTKRDEDDVKGESFVLVESIPTIREKETNFMVFDKSKYSNNNTPSSISVEY